MADEDLPQTYLITPPAIELSSFPDQLARVLDGSDVACLRLALSSRDEDLVLKTADMLREVSHARDVAIVITEHLGLVERLGLDGVHLEDGAHKVRYARKELGGDAIVGAFSGTSKHDAMTAAEAGSDYVSLGPVGASALGDGSIVEHDLFSWWSETIETPIVAEGHLTEDLVRQFAPVTDFFGIGEEIWNAEDPLATLLALQSAMS